MKRIVVYGWGVGFNKVGFTKLLRSEFGCSLSGAKEVTDGLLENRPVMIEVEANKLLRILSKLEELGVDFRVDEEGF